MRPEPNAWHRRPAARLALALVAGALALGAALAANAPPPGAKKEEFSTPATQAILIEADTGAVLFEKNADELIPPADLAKLMTAEVVLNEIKQGRLSPEKEFGVSEHAWRHGGAPSHTISMFAPIHSFVRVQDLLYGLMVQSANDAAIALAEGTAGTEAKFATAMTRRARQLGLAKSYFTNATGLPEPTLISTAREIAEIARQIVLTYPQQYKIYAEKEFTWNKIRQQNRNPLLTMEIGADGLAIGHTEDGGFNLAGAATQNGQRLIVVVNGLKGATERANEAKRLLEWGFRGFEPKYLFAAGQIVGSAHTYGGSPWSVPLVTPNAVTLMIPKGTNERILARIGYTGPVRPPVQEGQAIAMLKVWRGDNMVLETPLRAAEDVTEGGITRRAIDAASEFMIGLFRRGNKRI